MLHERDKCTNEGRGLGIYVPSLRERTSKVAEIATLHSMSSAMRIERSSALCTLRSSGSGRFLMIVFRMSTRSSAIPTAVEDETRKTRSGPDVMLEWQRG